MLVHAGTVVDVTAVPITAGEKEPIDGKLSGKVWSWSQQSLER